MNRPRVVIVYPVPMPYTFPVLRRIARSDEVELTVLYARRSLSARGGAPDPAAFGFPHAFLADRGRVFVGRDVREVDLNLGLPRALRRLRPDLVVVSGYVQPSALLGIAWALLHRRAYALWVESHDLRPRAPAKQALRRGLAGPVVRRAALLLPSGEAAAASLAALGGTPGRMMLFPHVPDPTLFHAREREEAAASMRRRLGVADTTQLLAFVGRLVESKGVHRLLQAHRDVYARTGAWLIVVGAGPLRDELEATNTPGVAFLGFLDPEQVAAVLRAADLAVSPSLVEPWGTFPLEAAACGCPVVATDVIPSAVELIGASEAGRLVPPGDPDALAAALLELLADRDALLAMSERAVAAASAYTPDRAAAAFLRGVRLALAGTANG